MVTELIVNGFPVLVNDPVADFVVKQKKSSNVEYFGYGSNGDVFVQFKSGDSYIYKGVSQDTLRQMLETESIGKFVRDHLVDQYNVIKHSCRFVERASDSQN